MKRALGWVLAVVLMLAVGGWGANRAFGEEGTAPAVKSGKNVKAKKKSAKFVYACPMCDFQSDKPGVCPHCHAKLVKKPVSKSQAPAKKVYACNKCGLEGDKPGECPHQCGGTMVLKN